MDVVHQPRRRLRRPGALHRRARRRRAVATARRCEHGSACSSGSRTRTACASRTDRGVVEAETARPHRRRLVAGRRAVTCRARPGCPPVARLAPADAAGALRARPDARLQPRARRRALLRLPGARHPRLQARVATTTSGQAATRTRSRANRRSRTRHLFARSPSATSPTEPARPWR